jgi:phytoene dehydrogenase-like protein
MLTSGHRGTPAPPTAAVTDAVVTTPPRPSWQPHDVIMVGGGHNGLVCGCYLARAGLHVLVVEAGRDVGGCCATVPVAAIGARVNICTDHTLVHTTGIPEELDLAAYGLRWLPVDPVQIALGWHGETPETPETPWIQFHDRARTLDALKCTHPGDVDGYRRYLRAAMPAAELVAELASIVPTPGNVARRLLARRGRGTAVLLAWQRRSAADVLSGFFGEGLLRATAAATGPALWGLPPDAPRTGLGALGYAMRHLAGVARPAGGSGALAHALRACLLAAGGEVRCDTPVAEVLVDGERVRGVRTRDGEILEAPIVVAAADPRQVSLGWLTRPPATAAGLVARWQARPRHDGYQSRLDVVAGTRPCYQALEPQLLDTLEVDDPLVATTVITPDLSGLAIAHHAAARGRIVYRPLILASVPAALDPGMRPAGSDGELLSLEVLFTPYQLHDGWATTREPERWLAVYAELLDPEWLDGVRRWQAMTPVDLERELNLERGYAPSFAGGPLAALLGRDPELTRYQTPIQGLYLTGAGTYPGAGVSGAPGRNTAAVVLAVANRSRARMGSPPRPST